MCDYTEISPYWSKLVAEIPDVREVWLIGSRVNPKNRPPRDWDLLVFADLISFENLKNKTHLNQENIDVLVVTDKDRFEQPWFTPSDSRSKPKQGGLSKWNWKKISETEATYNCSSPEDFDKGITRTCRGIRLYQKAV